MLTPESLLMLHTMRHAELLAELSARRPRATRRARSGAVARARAAFAAATRAPEPPLACCAA